LPRGQASENIVIRITAIGLADAEVLKTQLDSSGAGKQTEQMVQDAAEQRRAVAQ